MKILSLAASAAVLTAAAAGAAQAQTPAAQDAFMGRLNAL